MGSINSTSRTNLESEFVPMINTQLDDEEVEEEEKIEYAKRSQDLFHSRYHKM
jgi:hypothetical protein